MIKFGKEKECINQLMAAMKSGNEEKIKQAWQALHASIAEQVSADFAALQESNDVTVLAQRGYRQLTSKETKWYQKLIQALKSKDPKQAFTTIIGTDSEEGIMPTTIIEDVYKNLQEEHELLKVIDFQYVGYITNWILNDHSAVKAIWGNITEEIAKEIQSSLKVVKLDQNKLSAYAFVELGMLDLGPVFLDGYIRTVLAEAIMSGLEYGIIKGTGVKEPIGLIRKISKGTAIVPESGYPMKEKVTVTDFTPASYGALVAKMAKTEGGRKKTFSEVVLIVNQTDYLTKVMPASTVLNSAGVYVKDLFPFPTTVIVSNEVDDGTAVMFVKGEYFFGMGGDKEGIIEYSDEYKFVEDMRTFKVKQYGTGRALDNNSALYLDISKLEPAYIYVKDMKAPETSKASMLDEV